MHKNGDMQGKCHFIHLHSCLYNHMAQSTDSKGWSERQLHKECFIDKAFHIMPTVWRRLRLIYLFVWLLKSGNYMTGVKADITTQKTVLYPNENCLLWVAPVISVVLIRWNVSIVNHHSNFWPDKISLTDIFSAKAVLWQQQQQHHQKPVKSNNPALMNVKNSLEQSMEK